MGIKLNTWNTCPSLNIYNQIKNQQSCLLSSWSSGSQTIEVIIYVIKIVVDFSNSKADLQFLDLFSCGPHDECVGIVFWPSMVNSAFGVKNTYRKYAIKHCAYSRHTAAVMLQCQLC